MGENTVDPRAEPGTFEKTKAGWKRTDEPTTPASVPGATLSLDDAEALAQANLEAGFPVPPQIQAVLDEAKATNKTPAEPRPATGATPKPAPVAGEPKE